MPQGNLKTKVSVPKSGKKKSAFKKKNKPIRKGARVIAPKKAKLIESAKLKKFKMNGSKRTKEDESSSSDEEVMEMENEEINIEFEGFSASDKDMDGIRQLLIQLLSENSSVNISELATAVIAQNFIGTVLKQPEPCDTDSDGDDVYALVTCYSMTREKDDLSCSVVKYLKEKCELSETKSTAKQQFLKILTSSSENYKTASNSLGFVISERFINIPPQAVVPMYNKLLEELKEAKQHQHKSRYDFTHYVMICKICPGFQSSNKKRSSDEFYVNAEEELFAEEAVAKFDYSVEGDTEITKRRIILLNNEGFIKSVSKLKDVI